MDQEVEETAHVVTETLQIELLAVPGVASAEVEVGEGKTPAGVRVNLAPDADARRVGVEVQRVLAAHGMRSRFSSGDREQQAAVPPDSPPPPWSEPDDREAGPPLDPPPVASEPAVPTPPSSAPPVPVSVPELTSVSVEERSDGLTATVVLADGRRASRAVGLAIGELDGAVIAAVAEAAGESVTRAAVEWLEVDDGTVVTVVVRRVDGSLAAGAGVMQVGRAFAVGIATRSALEA